jgi:predicted alternative tryptophan synthase beta-subunit
MIKKPIITITDKQRANYVKGSVSDFVLLYQTKIHNEFERIKLTYKDQPKTGFTTSKKMMREEAEWNVSNVYYEILIDCIKDKKADMDFEAVRMVANNLLFDWKLSDWLFLKKQINY